MRQKVPQSGKGLDVVCIFLLMPFYALKFRYLFLTVFEDKPSDQIKNVGDLVTFICEVSGASQVSWKKDNKALEIETLDRFSVSKTFFNCV